MGQKLQQRDHWEMQAESDHVGNQLRASFSHCCLESRTVSYCQSIRQSSEHSFSALYHKEARNPAQSEVYLVPRRASDLYSNSNLSFTVLILESIWALHVLKEHFPVGIVGLVLHLKFKRIRSCKSNKDKENKISISFCFLLAVKFN